MPDQLLDTLHQDHRVLAHILEALDRQQALIHAGHEPDYELLEEILSYMADYPDRFHHPTEDAIFQRYLEKPDADWFSGAAGHR